MKINKKKLSIIIIGICISCTTSVQKTITEENSVKMDEVKIIDIPDRYDNLLQYDSIFENIEAIPLETNTNFLLTSVDKARIIDTCVYIQNSDNHLFVFSTSGKFIREIGSIGKGPGEYMSLRDFDIDKDGNIYILDFLKIHKYSNKGKYLKKYPFNYSPGSTIICNPEQFAICDENSFFIWGGSFSIKENKNKNLFMMYKMNKEGEFTERYFPVRHMTVLCFNRFSKFDNHFNVIPWYGNNIIFGVDKTKVWAKYKIDFGKLEMDQLVPENYQSLSEFKARADQKYANAISNVVETKEWLFFMFRFKGYVKNVYYSKIKNKAFVSRPYPRISDRIMPWIIQSSTENEFIAFIEPRIILEDLEKVNEKNESQNEISEAMHNTTINDNHIMLICKMKNYQ